MNKSSIIRRALRRDDSRAEIFALAERHNRATDGRLHLEAMYLLTVARGA
jgi:hypothetical protein